LDSYGKCPAVRVRLSGCHVRADGRQRTGGIAWPFIESWGAEHPAERFAHKPDLCRSIANFLASPLTIRSIAARTFFEILFGASGGTMGAG
jgi:hypothetical protein